MARVVKEFEDEQMFKEDLVEELKEDGYYTYGCILELLKLKLVHSLPIDPDFEVAHIVMQQGVIVMNSNIPEEARSVVVRHEILHQWLDHLTRGKAFLEKKLVSWGFDFLEPGELSQLVTNVMFGLHDIENIMTDFEISNVGYTEADKEKVKNLTICGILLGGMITEEQRTSWTDFIQDIHNVTFEMMYEREMKENNIEFHPKVIEGTLKDERTFIDKDGVEIHSYEL